MGGGGGIFKFKVRVVNSSSLQGAARLIRVTHELLCKLTKQLHTETKRDDKSLGLIHSAVIVEIVEHIRMYG